MVTPSCPFRFLLASAILAPSLSSPCSAVVAYPLLVLPVDTSTDSFLGSTAQQVSIAAGQQTFHHNRHLAQVLLILVSGGICPVDILPDVELYAKTFHGKYEIP